MSPNAKHIQRYPRFLAHIHVEMLTRGLELHRSEKTQNISRGGMFICSDYQPAAGEKIHLRLFFAQEDSYFDLKSQVIWVSNGDGPQPQGFGVEFVDLTPEQAQLVEKILAPYEKNSLSH